MKLTSIIRRNRASSLAGAPATAVGPARRHHGRRHRGQRIGAVVAISTVLFVLGAGVASAHVTVNPNEAAAGSYAKITFRVPTESATASTVALQVLLPTDHPFPNVSIMPVPGWTAMPAVTKFDKPVVEGKFNLTEATSSVTWTAQDGNGITPGEFQEFSLSVGPVPDVASLTLPAMQTYSDGTTVEWKDVAGPGVDPHSLEHPAPVLTITTASTDGAAAATSDTTAQILGAVALVIAAIALVFAVLGWRRGTIRKITHDGVPAASGAGPGGTIDAGEDGSNSGATPQGSNGD